MTILRMLVDRYKEVPDICYRNRYTLTVTDDNNDV